MWQFIEGIFEIILIIICWIFIISGVIYFFKWIFLFFWFKKQENNDVKLEKYDFYRKIEIIIRIILVIIWLVYPILAFIFCNWNEGHWITGCVIPFINKGFAEAVMCGVFFSVFTLWAPIIFYIFCILWSSKFLAYIIVKILKIFYKAPENQ